jgi:phosphatidylserine/phosphatidylglycerophosphate/cardiolipin synthase-like enzyme
MKVALSLLALVACTRASGGSDDDPMIDQPMGTPDAVATTDYCNATDPRPDPVVVDPTPEASERPYVDALASAQHSIDLAVYLMGYGGILDTLEAKAKAGVRVRVILDQLKKSTNQKYFDRLVAAGAEVKWSDPAFSYFHAKYFVVDGVVAVMSTGNYSKDYSIDLERNFAITDRDLADVQDLGALFEADWTGTAPVMTCTRMVISPINARDRILAVIEGATTTLDIESMQFADGGVRDAVAARIAAGVTVRALLADPSWIDANAEAATWLKSKGVTVKSIPHLHTKAIVADGLRAYVGSENLSYTSLEKNREVGVVLVEDASIAPLRTTFDKDWASGTTL